MSSNYIESIKQVYPDLSIKDYYPNEIGQNNDVLIINKSIVFRFPKYQKGIIQLKKETEILEYIRNIVSIQIPHPIYKSFDKLEPGKVFTGYNLIDGVPFWRGSLEKIKSVELIKGLALQLVGFLREVHSISKEKALDVLTLDDNNPCKEMSELFDKIQNKLFPYIRKEAKNEITQSFKNFINGKGLDVKTTLIHGDFGASNILWNPEISRISGIIDFGGSSLGDPAYDFAGILSSYGKDFFNMCINLYPNGNEISERVKFYKSTFALQEALHGVENNDKKAFEYGIKDYR
ncbi:MULTISPECIES: phosphotransferase family protein [Paraliobacillus]|uniref:phosphotransferase family protein n=1 Tax=Paraliobacillus TaxID=200903 RepID=UPI000DD3AA8F|nr:MULTISPECIES: aminoglycoside phosphotransferase family protein [Paraliobacillus]